MDDLFINYLSNVRPARCAEAPAWDWSTYKHDPFANYKMVTCSDRATMVFSTFESLIKMKVRGLEQVQFLIEKYHDVIVPEEHKVKVTYVDKAEIEFIHD